MSKNQQDGKKERHEAIEMCFSKPTKVNGIIFDNNSIRMMTDGQEVMPKASSYVKFINKDNGSEKKILKLDMERATISVASIFENTNVLIALDTNTKNKKSVAVAMFYLVLKTTEGYEFCYMGTLIKKFEEIIGSNELNALYSLVSEIKAGNVGYVIRKDKALIIIDHNLGKLEQFNCGELPLIEEDRESYLPENIKLAYASADKKNDSVFNEMIAECDKYATKLLNDD